MRRSIVAATATVAFFLGCAANHAYAERQPRMRDALAHLESALADLRAASADKGGYRVKAISLTEQAITSVRDGIQYDNRH
ncbi:MULTISPECIES: hypothetical protein [Corallococcus]|uniref:hypothetical protein n=1 Tax=Corallococcus TaxID=83461 RepID=UPI00117BF39F|nr:MULTISPECIES: hypothetical protein [Corallococcus]NBD09961.1 hypothetical protein [Corallococcus silvisoli]TSC20954.1 hypothetical protein FOF48_34975 [Corallococcus sp. Z5C101001]